MTFEINLVFCMLVVLTGSSQTRGQSSALPPVLTPSDPLSPTGSSASRHLTEDPGIKSPQTTQNPAGRDDETSNHITDITKTEETVHSADESHKSDFLNSTISAAVTSLNVPAQPAAASPSGDLSSTPTAPSPAAAAGPALLTRDPLGAYSSQPAHTTHASTAPPRSESLSTTSTAQPTTAGRPRTPAAGRRPAGATHRDAPSELNVGDEDLKRPRSSSPLDPLLAGLLSVFIVTTAIVFVILFLKFRQRNNHPEFHRLQDLPMDDLMEDTPLSRYSY